MMGHLFKKQTFNNSFKLYLAFRWAVSAWKRRCSGCDRRCEETIGHTVGARTCPSNNPCLCKCQTSQRFWGHWIRRHLEYIFDQLNFDFTKLKRFGNLNQLIIQMDTSYLCCFWQHIYMTDHQFRKISISGRSGTNPSLNSISI